MSRVREMLSSVSDSSILSSSQSNSSSSLEPEPEELVEAASPMPVPVLVVILTVGRDGFWGEEKLSGEMLTALTDGDEILMWAGIWLRTELSEGLRWIGWCAPPGPGMGSPEVVVVLGWLFSVDNVPAAGMDEVDPELLGGWRDRAGFRWRSVPEGDDDDDKWGVLGVLGDWISAVFMTISETSCGDDAEPVVCGSNKRGIEDGNVDDLNKEREEGDLCSFLTA